MKKNFKILTLLASCVILGAFHNTLFARDESPNSWKAWKKAMRKPTFN